MKLSKNFEYLATIKKNHKIVTQFDKKEDDQNIDIMWRHYKSLSHARRLNGIPTIKPYTTALHCYYTGLLFEDIASYESIEITKRETRFVYRHDLFETITGDVLLPVKIHSQKVKNMWECIECEIAAVHPLLWNYVDENAETYFTPEAFTLFKACDLFELYLFCQEEMELGNMSKGISAVVNNCRKLLPEFNISYVTEYVNSPARLLGSSLLDGH